MSTESIKDLREQLDTATHAQDQAADRILDRLEAAENRVTKLNALCKKIYEQHQLLVELGELSSACMTTIERRVRGIVFDPNAGELCTVKTSELKALVAEFGDADLAADTPDGVQKRLDFVEGCTGSATRLALSLPNGESALDGKDPAKFMDLATDTISGLIARIKELEAAQQPRAMADAPRDTDIMLTIGARYRGDEDEPHRMGLLGWLPLPDREDSPESPGIGASGKTEGV